jgi:hypothetical protein
VQNSLEVGGMICKGSFIFINMCKFLMICKHVQICYFYILQTKSSLEKIFYKVVYHLYV